MLVGYGMERLAYRPLRHAPRLAPLITAIGVSIILQHVALMIWSRNILAFPTQLVEHLGTVAPDDQRWIMRDNAMTMLGLS